MLIDCVLKDLTSTNVLEVCYALAAVNKLINAEMIPTVLQQVLALLDSKRCVLSTWPLYHKMSSIIAASQESVLGA